MKVKILPKKLIAHLFMAAMMWAGFTQGVTADSLSKNLKSTKVSLDINQGKIIDIMHEISDRTDYVFIYENGLKKELNKKVNITNKESLHAILVDIAMQSNLEFRAVNNNIVVRKKTESGKEAVEYVQSITVTGRVISSEDGEGIPGVNVLIKGTSQGTVTDIDGNFKIDVPDASAVLVFSSVGFVTQEITVGNQTQINVTMSPDVTALQEVVVTALGIKREERSLGYSVGEVKGKDLVMVPQENVLNSLAGRIPGVAISSTGAQGSSVSMVIRGATSLTSDNQPLFVIDGVPVNNTLNNVSQIGRDNRVDYGNAIADLNPDDIESISVLKGPSAAALYGSRAGNGVVLVTTKSGKKNKGLGISINSSTIFDIPYKYLPIHNLFANGSRPYTPDNFPANEYGSLIIPETSAGWVGPELDKGYNAIQWPYTVDENGDPVPTPLVSHPDNPATFAQTAITSTNNIAIANVTEFFNYRVSYTNMSSRGNVPNSDLYRNSVNVALDAKPHKRFTISTNVNILGTYSHNRPAGNRGTNPWQGVYETNSHIDMNVLKDYWDDGKEGLQQRNPYNWDNPAKRKRNNPYFLAYEAINAFKRDRIYGNLKAEWQITDDFKVHARYSLDQYNEQRETKVAKSYTKDANGIYGIINMARMERNIDFLATYNKMLESWSFNISAGGNLLYQKGNNVTTATKNRGSGLIIPGLYTLSNIAPDNLSYGSYKYEKVINSVYGLASIGFKGMAYLDLTARNDWSSTLPPENRSYFYPSASLSLLFNEMFNMDPNKVSLIKLRGGFAQVGNDTGPYRLYPTLGNAGAWGGVTRLTKSGSILNPNLKPEIATSYEIGTELGFWNNRLRFDFTVYQQDNRNQILPIALPPSSGYYSKQINAGLVRSKGIEASLGITPISKDNWNWDVNFVFSRNRTTLVELTEGIDYIRLWSDAKGGAYTWVGEEIGNIIDRDVVRVKDPNSEYYGWPILDDEGYQNDDRTLQDENGNRVAPIIGNFNPDFTLGIQTSLTYKGFTFSANIDWRQGGDFVSQTFRYGESDFHTMRYLEKTIKWFGPQSELPQYLKDNYGLWSDGIEMVGGPTKEWGGFEHTEGGITLYDGTFNPGVTEKFDDDGNFIGYEENLGGPNTKYIRYQDNYPWSFTKTATFGASFVKLREVSFGYTLPTSAVQSIGLQHLTISLFSRNIILWTEAKIAIDPELAFQPESGVQGSGIQFKQGIERFNVNPWTMPIGFKISLGF